MRNNIAAQLDTVHSVIGHCLTECAGTNKSAVLKAELAKAKNQITASVEALQNYSKPRAFTRTRKALVAIGNTVEGLYEGLATREIAMKDFRAVCSNLQTKFVPNFVKHLAAEVEALSGSTSVVQPEPEAEPEASAQIVVPERLQGLSADLKAVHSLADIRRLLAAAPPLPADPEVVDHEQEAKDAADEESEEERSDREHKEAEYRRQNADDISSLETLTILRAKRNLLPQRLVKPNLFTIAKLPLVPIFPENFNITSERNLKRNAIRHSIIQGYAFLEEQLILCVSRTQIEKADVSKATKSDLVVKSKIKDIKKVKEKTNDLSTELTQRNIDLADELAKLNKRYEAMSEKTSKLELGYRATISKIYKISKPEKERIEAAFLSRKEELTELDDSETKQLRRLHTGTGLVQPTTKELEKLKTAGDRQDALDAHRSSVNAVLLSKAKAHIATLKKSERKELLLLKTKLEELRAELKKPRAIQKRIRDLKEMMKSVTSQLGDLENDAARRDKDIHNTKKLLKPKVAHVTPSDYAMTVLAHINEASGANYTLVTNEFKVNIRNADILCFWIMPAQKMNALFRDSGGKTKVQWSFPWDA